MIEMPIALRKVNKDAGKKPMFNKCPICKNIVIRYSRYFNVQLAICSNCSWTVQVQGEKTDLIEEWNRGNYYK